MSEGRDKVSNQHAWLIAGAACCAGLAGCSTPQNKPLWPPREPIEKAQVLPSECDSQGDAPIVDCFDHVHFVTTEGGALVMQAPVCSDVTVRRWSDKLPNGVVTVFYRCPNSYSVVGEKTDRIIVVQCIQHPLRWAMPNLNPDTEPLEKGFERIYMNGGGTPHFPHANGTTVPSNPDDKIYSDKYVEPVPHVEPAR